MVPSFLDCMVTIPKSASGRARCRRVIAVTGLAVIGAVVLLRWTGRKIYGR